MISCPTPDIASGDDADLLVKAGEVLCDGRLFRLPDENGLRVRVDYELSETAVAQAEAMLIFHRCLGVMRAWRPDFGELMLERAAKWGYGEFRDETTLARSLNAGPAIERGRGGLDQLLRNARVGIDSSPRLANACWLNGRISRTTADFFMIIEYTQREFSRHENGRRAVETALGVTVQEQQDLEDSAHNLCPLDGGRHANQRKPWKIVYSMHEVEQRTSDLLKRWILHFEQPPP